MLRQTSFAIIGNGWRADFFHRIAQMLPDEFKVSAVKVRTEERALEIAEEKKVMATTSLDEMLLTNPDFVVLCVPREAALRYLKELMERAIPVLCETPPAKDIDELQRLWEFKETYSGRIQVAEQYLLQPLYSGIENVINEKIIGEVSNTSLSALHDYHAISIFRRYLKAGFGKCRIYGRNFEFPVTSSGSRAGADFSGKIKTMERIMAVFEFENGKKAFYDFSGEQYHSYIRTRRLNIQGLRGEINDFEVRYLNEENEAHLANINRVDEGVYNNSGPFHAGLTLNGKYVYRSPFNNTRFNDDEIAVAGCLRGMASYVHSGQEVYSLEDGLQDTYLGFLLGEAVKTGREIVSDLMPWAKENMN